MIQPVHRALISLRGALMSFLSGTTYIQVLKNVLRDEAPYAAMIRAAFAVRIVAL